MSEQHANIRPHLRPTEGPDSVNVLLTSMTASKVSQQQKFQLSANENDVTHSQ